MYLRHINLNIYILIRVIVNYNVSTMTHVKMRPDARDDRRQNPCGLGD